MIGDGGWGTTLAILLHENGHIVKLWSPFEEYAQELDSKRINRKFLPGISIPKEINITHQLVSIFAGLDFCIMAVPAEYVRSVAQKMAEFYPTDLPILSVTKGIEKNTLLRMSQILENVLPTKEVAVLSGPSHAEEVARHIPTTVVIASSRQDLSEILQPFFMNSHFRVYTSIDVLGVELGGALKNVIAIAAGICDGLGLGSNTKAALITRGLAEIARLGVAMGARASTFAGLSGMGDLITTCISSYGRNRNLGMALAQGKTLKQALAETPMVVEGVYTAQSAHALAKQYEIDMPIANAIYQVLYEDKKVGTAVKELMERDARAEGV